MTDRGAKKAKVLDSKPRVVLNAATSCPDCGTELFYFQKQGEFVCGNFNCRWNVKYEN